MRQVSVLISFWSKLKGYFGSIWSKLKQRTYDK